MASRRIEIEIVGDERDLSRSFGRAAKDADTFAGRLTGKVGHGLATVGKAAGVAGLALGAAFAGVVKVGVDSLIEHEKASAQTAAVLKSTGGAAGVTQQQIEELADSIEKMSGLDDLAVQAGQNLLLTFTNIKNEAGAGNDVFTQTTKIMADMSVALGQDTKSSAIQLGKALNDPIKGVTALQRVGVSFTQAQRDQIKALVEAGNTMGAQKLILAELTKEFGGSAQAAGETLGGRLQILKARLEEVAEKVAARVLPIFESSSPGSATTGRRSNRCSRSCSSRSAP
ncbi:MAG: phage tail length tape measure family protein [Thermoleophilia bacterium]